MKKINKVEKQNIETVGVVIGRFQIHTLHKGHKHLIDIVKKENDKLCILLGSSGGNLTRRNPLPFTVRKEMIKSIYKDAIVYEIIDSKTWSKNLDDFLEKTFKGKQIKLYGSRDCFANWYFGKNKVIIVKEKHDISGTIMRGQKISPKDKESFRLGMIESQKARFLVSYQTVDIALIDEKKGMVILGRKNNNPNWYLPGGFVDPTDESLEFAAKRELSEEVTGVKTKNNFKYTGSYRVNDHRYRNEEDKILTSLIVINYKSGTPVAGDDLVEVKWFSFKESKEAIAGTHLPLINMLLKSLKIK